MSKSDEAKYEMLLAWFDVYWKQLEHIPRETLQAKIAFVLEQLREQQKRDVRI